MRKSLALLFVVMVLLALGAPGCNMTPGKTYCDPGQTVWNCAIPPTPGCAAVAADRCATDVDDAMAIARGLALDAGYKLSSDTVINCYNTFQTSYTQPSYGALGDPSCIVTTDDDACLACAKTSCCGEYSACAVDTNCSCLVVCLFQGGTVAACTSADNCGPASAVSNTTATCLAAACPSQCENPGGMAGGMCLGMGAGGGTTTGSTSTGGACTPGSAGPGESCFSDGDCSSCACNTATMTCN